VAGDNENTGYLSRQILPDMYPRRDDPSRPSPAPGAGLPPLSAAEQIDETISGTLTSPGQRPSVVQRGVNFNFSVTNIAQPIMLNYFECDSVIIDCPSTAANSVFVGWGSGVNSTSGLEVRAGLPIEIASDNTREQWEIQRALEYMATLQALAMGTNLPSPYRAPRVVIDLSKLFLIAAVAGPTLVSIMTFNVPEQQ
jgi:hypothetical protein